MRILAGVSVLLMIGALPLRGQAPAEPDTASVGKKGAAVPGTRPDASGPPPGAPGPLPPARTILRLPDLRAVVRAPRRSHIGYALDRVEARLRGETVGEWLSGLPGVTITGRGAGGSERITIRGSRSQEVRVTLDGMPLTDPLTGATDLSIVPASSIESARVTLGAGSSVGWGGTAGSLALRSREPEPGLRVRGLAGSYGQRSTEVEAGWRTDLLSVGLFARSEGARNDYPFQNRVLPGDPIERRANADGDAWSVLGRATLSRAPVSFVARTDGLERGAPGRMANHVWDQARWRERRTSVGASWTPGPGSRVGLSWSRRSTRFQDLRVVREDKLAAEQFVFAGAAPLPGGFDVGWEGSWATVSGDQVDERQRWRGGLRASRSDQVGRSVTVLSALSLDAATEGFALSPSLGARWAFRPGWEARVRGSQARRLPTFADLFLRPGTGARPNPDLRPERVVFDIDFGIAWEKETFSASATWFRRKTLDPIIWFPSVVAVWTPRNLGRLDARGLEFASAWGAGPWAVQGAATWQRSRVTFANGARNTLPYAPALSGSLSVGHDTRTRGVFAQLEVVGRRATSILDSYDLSPYALLNIRARQTFPLVGVLAEIQLGVINALGAGYERVELFPEPGRRFELGLSLSVGERKRLPDARHDRSFPRAASLQQEKTR